MIRVFLTAFLLGFVSFVCTAWMLPTHPAIPISCGVFAVLGLVVTMLCLVWDWGW